MNFHQAVQKNLEHLGTPASDWIAVEILGMEEIEEDSGEGQEMPVFSFPDGFEKAPSLYTGECCNLCGTKIKNVFWIQNDNRRWIMPVGSECVTHFGEGESGLRIAKKTVWEQNRGLLIALIELRRTIWQTYSRRVNIGYGRYETKIFARSPEERKADQFYKGIKELVGKLDEQSCDAAITRWTKKCGAQAQKLLIDTKEFLESKSNFSKQINCQNQPLKAV